MVMVLCKVCCVQGVLRGGVLCAMGEGCCVQGVLWVRGAVCKVCYQ